MDDLHATDAGFAGRARATAEAFARAFDASDLESIAPLLAPECGLGGGIRGRDAVLAAFRDAIVWAERAFDDVRHESGVTRTGAAWADLEVTTYLMRVPGRWHRFRRARRVEIDGDGRIAGIEDRAAPLAVESLNAFVSSCAAPPVPDALGG